MLVATVSSADVERWLQLHLFEEEETHWSADALQRSETSNVINLILSSVYHDLCSQKYKSSLREEVLFVEEAKSELIKVPALCECESLRFTSEFSASVFEPQLRWILYDAIAQKTLSHDRWLKRWDDVFSIYRLRMRWTIDTEQTKLEWSDWKDCEFANKKCWSKMSFSSSIFVSWKSFSVSIHYDEKRRVVDLAFDIIIAF